MEMDFKTRMNYIVKTKKPYPTVKKLLILLSKYKIFTVTDI